MVLVCEKFEAKISVIEESCDLQTLTVIELTKKLRAQEQSVLIRKDEVVEDHDPMDESNVVNKTSIIVTGDEIS
ncbi:hypothetical protein CR513_04050, partial [Mucuna pruriens]